MVGGGGCEMFGFIFRGALPLVFVLGACASDEDGAPQGDVDAGLPDADGGMAASDGSVGDGAVTADEPRWPVGSDPGSGPWELVADDEVADVCGLDPDLLAAADATLNRQWGVVRYGKLCHLFYPGDVQG